MEQRLPYQPFFDCFILLKVRRYPHSNLCHESLCSKIAHNETFINMSVFSCNRFGFLKCLSNLKGTHRDLSSHGAVIVINVSRI